jgi:DNA-binding Lrp family transcriptional regulator
LGTITVDRFDLQLLVELQRDGQATNHVLGERVHLSTSQVSRRVQRLHDAGVIDHYCALINPSAIGLDVIAYSEVTLDRQNSRASEVFEREITDLPQVLECYTLAGQADYLLRIVASDLNSLSEFMTTKILRMQGVANVKSTITLRQVKHTHALPMDHVLQPRENRKKIQFAG